jgi:hypothetical protein
VAQDRPDSMGSEAVFIECMVQLYRKFQSGQHGGAVGGSLLAAGAPEHAVPLREPPLRDD